MAYSAGHITWGPATSGEQAHFAIAGPDLKLFWDQSATPADRGEPGARPRSFAEPAERFTLVGMNQSVKNAKCIAWAPAEQPAALLAAGLESGRILIADFRGRWSMEDCTTMDLTSGHSPANSLAWHPTVAGRLAGGLQRMGRSDGSVMVWDVERTDWQWLGSSEGEEWPAPIVSSRSRGSMERLSALAVVGSGSGSGERLVDASLGVPTLTRSVTHSSSGLSAGSSGKGSDGGRSGSQERLSGGRLGSGELTDGSGSGGFVGTMRRDVSSSFTTSSQSSAASEPVGAFAAGAATLVAEMGSQEQSQAVGWLPDSPSCLAVGTLLQWLRVYDVRTRRAVAAVAAHPGTPVRGVRVSPTAPHHIATFEKPDTDRMGGGASVVKLWDSRRLETPLLSWAVGAPLVDVAWIPSAEHDGNLATLVAGGPPSDAGAILLWSTHGAADMSQNKDDEAASSVPPAPPMVPTPARTIRFTGDQPPTAFTWHPTAKRALVLASDGQIAVVTLRPPTAVAWHGDRLAIGFGSNLGEAYGGVSNSVETAMRERVLAGYAMSAQQNAELTAPMANGGARLCDDQGVHFAWQWVDTMEQLAESNMLGKRLDGGKRDHPFHGVRQAIPKGASSRELGSEVYTLTVDGLQATVYGGHARQLTMRLCGWEGIAGQVDHDAATSGQDPQAQVSF